MSANQVSRDLDLASRAIDLTNTIVRGTKLDLIKIVQGASTSVAGDVCKWLGREQISERSFVLTMEHGLNIAHPNEAGLRVLQNLEESASRLYGLNLILPGALGRTILYDEQLKWVGTTEAVLLRHHSTEYAVNTLCRLFVVHNMDEEDARANATESMMRPVLTKVVDSIHLHVTNMGRGISPPPKHFEQLTKHYMDHFNLADMISSLAKVSDCDSLLQMNCYIVEVIDWVLTHWIGQLVLCVDSEIVFKKTLGASNRTLTVVINNTCNVKGACDPGTHFQGFDLGRVIGQVGKAVEGVYSGGLDVGEAAADFNTDSCYRSPLYDIRNPFKTRDLYLNSKEQKTAERVCQEVVRSIIDLPVAPLWHTENDAYDQGWNNCTVLGLTVKNKSATKYRWWLKKVPTIVQKNLGSNLSAENGPCEVILPKHPGKDDTDSGYRRYKYSIAEIADCYPGVRSAMQMAHERCECGCNDNNATELSATTSELDDGCLVNLIFAEILLQIVHAMSEAAGARDISNLRGPQSAMSLIEGAKVFLGCIAAYGRIYWNNWLRLCFAAVTGLSYDMVDDASINNLSTGLLFAVAGSMTVGPSWFTLEEEIKLKGSWGIEQLNGAVKGVVSETALIVAQATSGAVKEITPSPISVVSGGEDADDVHLESVVFSSTDNLHSMATIAKTSSALRLISPLSIYKAVMEAAQPQCTHDSVDEVTIIPWSVNDIIQGWNRSSPPRDGVPHIALVANSFLKQNVAIGLAGVCALQRGNCCFACLAKKASMLKAIGICGMPNKKLNYITGAMS